MTAYYNEFDPAAAAWLRELIKAGHIAPGVVDERSIEDVLPSDLQGFKENRNVELVEVDDCTERNADA